MAKKKKDMSSDLSKDVTFQFKKKSMISIYNPVLWVNLHWMVCKSLTHLKAIIIKKDIRDD